MKVAEISRVIISWGKKKEKSTKLYLRLHGSGWSLPLNLFKSSRGERSCIISRLALRESGKYTAR